MLPFRKGFGLGASNPCEMQVGRGLLGVWLSALAILMLGAPKADAGHGALELVSVNTEGGQEVGSNSRSAVSADGRKVSFVSSAALADSDTNGQPDVYVRDLSDGRTELVSVALDGSASGQGAWADPPSISGDGRFVAFRAVSDGIVADDANGQADIFVRDLVGQTTDRVSVSSSGEEANAPSQHPSISGDGRYVAFTSGASNLVPDDVGDHADIFIRDRAQGTTDRVSLTWDGREPDDHSSYPSLSTDGRTVAFVSWATKMLPDHRIFSSQVYVRDMDSATTELASIASDGSPAWDFSGASAISADGRYVTFTSVAENLASRRDTNYDWDVYVHDRLTDQTELVSAGSDGSSGNGTSRGSSVSSDGRYVAFFSHATDLVLGDVNRSQDVFVRDRAVGQTFLVSTSSEGVESMGAVFDLSDVFRSSDAPQISSDASVVVFPSDALTLWPGDRNPLPDIFVKRLGSSCPSGTHPGGPISRRSHASVGEDVACPIAEAGL